MGDDDMHKDASIALIGDGKLAELTVNELQKHYTVFRLASVEDDLPNEAPLTLVLYDDWHPDLYMEAEKVLRQSGRVWLGGFVTVMEGVVGPLVDPGKQGCSQCADFRRSKAGGDSEEILNNQLSLILHGKIVRDAPVPFTVLKHMSHLLAEESHRFMTGLKVNTEDHMYVVDFAALECSLHYILPDPACQTCGRLPDDSPKLAAVELEASLKISPNDYRCFPLEYYGDFLKEYYDEKTGTMNKKMRGLSTMFADAAVCLPTSYRDEIVGGKSHSFAASEKVAILEGLERMCGISPRGRRVTVWESYRSMKGQALNPLTVGVYSKDQYESTDFPFEPFDCDQVIPWVWGYSLMRQCPLLVPKQLAYYSGFSGFVHEFSNGCALGGNKVEAIFHGILEIVERDSFLLTWYAQLPIPRLDPRSVNDISLRLMIERLSMVAGYDLFLFNSTMEHGIPSIWAVAKNRNKKGANLLCAAGAHLDPERAAQSAVFEIAGSIPRIEEAFQERQEELLAMLDDPFQVEQMEDHAALYSLPHAEPRLSFLLDSGSPIRSFDEEYTNPPLRADLLEDLQDVLGRLHSQGLDVIVIDQTTPEIASRNLVCVKVLIPGMIPMSFGHSLTRLTGLDRLYDVPMKLGFMKERFSPVRINPFPHPFL
jgi:ribosomal protein S12 methylthiotransferase accessory factor